MKKMMTLLVLSFCVFCMSISSVNASEYYKNTNNVSFTEQEYNFYTKLYGKDFVKVMPEEVKERFKGKELDVSKIEYRESSPAYGLMSNGNYYETPSKILRIAKYTNGSTMIVISATWKKAPNVRSYDLIGAYLQGVSRIDTPYCVASHTGGQSTPAAIKYQDSGFGASILVPSGRNIVYTAEFEVLGKGRVYASYQHARKLISLKDSQTFNISHSGIGNVFDFPNWTISDKYDGMGGVSIDI